ncbi:unnamed protein product [Danaus chrysippus]|uniref:(African queen) hypothetical protein n=1 Tax=Danaus chrysippus TaxID=151541 RepID=A0A8J2QRA4_9NEOP|nr:unnamed protein product [Danaus chrysippus]
MASVWFIVTVLFCINQVLASYRDCSNLDNIKNCNECIRCGAHWCNNPHENRRCSLERFDNWCPNHQESLPYLTEVSEKGKILNPKYRVQTIHVGQEDEIEIIYQYKTGEPKVNFVANSTQKSNFIVSNSTSCSSGSCTTTLNTVPGSDFCENTGSTNEFFNVKLTVSDVDEEAVLKFHVPCACGCTEKVEKLSPTCNGRGDLSCGVCTCQDKWSGTFCDQPICDEKRGDVPCIDSSRSSVECFGNGVCGRCDKCECFTNRPGSRYFDRNDYCIDICTKTNECDECLIKPHLGKCHECHFPLYKQKYNESLTSSKDEYGRHMWIKCNDTINDCNIEYVVMRDDRGESYFMVTKNCDPKQEGQESAKVNLTVPILLGLVAVLAAASAVGYFVYKSRPPPVPLTDPMYTNIGAEDCTGENPLYKPPTSSFKNPTYGKW